MTKTQLLKSAKIISFLVLVCNDPLLKLFPLLREGGTLYFFSCLSFSCLLELSGCDIVFSWEREREMKMLGYGFESKWGMPILFLFSCLCVILELAWADLACIYGSVAFVILIIYISWLVRAKECSIGTNYSRNLWFKGTGIDLGWLRELGLYRLVCFLCL